MIEEMLEAVKGCQDTPEWKDSVLRSAALRHRAMVKSRAKQKGKQFRLSRLWFVERFRKGTCELTGIPFVLTEYKQGKGQNSKKTSLPFSPSVDKINPNGHYVESNCRLILNSVNAFKGTMTDEQVLQVTEQLYLGLAERLEK
jgi:hypothetical protein